jgi:flagellar motility protein MotE (MotC chaperone)
MTRGLTAENLTPANSTGRSTTRQPAAGGAPGSPAAANAADSRAGILDREAAVSMKEKELKKLDANLEGKIRKLDETRKGMESSLTQQKKADTERYQKMVKLYRALRPEEAAKLIDKLEEDLAMELMSRMDQKTMAKMIPYLNQARVLKWTRLSLKGS